MTDDYGMRPVTPEKTCDNPAPHGEHEWIWDRILRRQCPGVPGAVICTQCGKVWDVADVIAAKCAGCGGMELRAPR